MSSGENDRTALGVQQDNAFVIDDILLSEIERLRDKGISLDERRKIEDKLCTLIYPVVLRWAAKDLQDEDAADACQLVLSQFIEDVRNGAVHNYLPFLYGITRHRVTDVFRALSRRRRVYEQYASMQNRNGHSEATGDPQAVSIDNERGTIIRHEMDRLKPHFREILDLHYFKELSLKTISELLGIPVNTAKTRLYHARLKLGDSLIRRGFRNRTADGTNLPDA